VVFERTTPSRTPYLDIFRAIPEFTLDQQTYVRLGFSLADAYARIDEETTRIAAGSLLLAAAGAFAALLLQRTIVGPLDRMIATIRTLQRGDYSARVKAQTNDELRVLADEFNAMAQAIQTRDAELARINEALRRANRVKDEFSAAMSHELKTPLHAIRAYAQLLLEGIDGPLADAQRRDVEAILAAGDHLLHLIEGILRYSALEAGATAPQITSVDAAAVVEQARKNVAHLARSKGLPIHTRVSDRLVVRADETMLRQILINLLHNAIKYTNEGQITLTTSAQDGQVVFAVTDTGVGIAPGHEHEVFEPFQRAGHPGRREIDGIGLGLAVAKRYVEQQGGRIWFERAAGGGTTFYVTLPSGERS
jgi:signal transduction histidine kinase